MRIEHPGPVPGQGDRITEIWAWTCIDPLTDTEGIVSLKSPQAIPLIASNETTARKAAPFVKELARQMEAPIRLRRFVPDAVAMTVDPYP